ncbi:hypothetical protein [Desulfonema magnum]|uniref:DsrE/DsrF-like family protein n=1 Tax=Desulfonema magnum TaxID=45655 RepID=A0A975GSX9_9BACT|nr:hypothetical protein [Desulfonema magnum]QTA92504.1 Uncharacterized protein dnm_085840 [Desulfonema magnum]
MEYQDSDVLLFYGIIIVFVIIYFVRNKRSKPETTRKAETGSQPDYHRTPEYPVGVRNAANAAGGEIKGIFVVVTSSEPQTQLVAMSLSSQTLNKGKYVRVLLCGPGGDIALKNGKEVILKPIDKSPQMILKGLIKSGVTVEVCPFYLANKEGASESDLIEGIKKADPPLVADGLLEPGVKLFTF